MVFLVNTACTRRLKNHIAHPNPKTKITIKKERYAQLSAESRRQPAFPGKAQFSVNLTPWRG